MSGTVLCPEELAVMKSPCSQCLKMNNEQILTDDDNCRRENGYETE